MDDNVTTPTPTATFHHAPQGVTAALPHEPYFEYLDKITASATSGRTWLDPVPHEHAEHLAQNFLRGHWVIAPILAQSGIRVRPDEKKTWVSPSQLERLRDGDAVLATQLTDFLTPVHSVGSVTVHETREGQVYGLTEEPVLRYFVAPRGGHGDGYDTYQEAFDQALVLSEFAAAPFSVHAELRVDGNRALASVNSALHFVTIQLAVVDYDDDTCILGYEVVEGTVGA